jgi:polar amino acid transport system substrate-binding protein
MFLKGNMLYPYGCASLGFIYRNGHCAEMLLFQVLFPPLSVLLIFPVIVMSMRFALVSFLLAVILFAQIGPVSAQTQNANGGPRQHIVLYGEDNSPPYAYFNGAVMAGAYTDILKHAAARLPQYDIEFSGVPFKRGIELLQRGEIMAFYPPYLDPERNWVSRYSVPLIEQTVVVMCTQKFARDRVLVNYPVDYIGARFGNTAGYRLVGEKLFEMARQHEVTLEEAHSTEINLRRLLAGRIDCYVNDRLAVETALAELGVDRAASARKIMETAVLGSHQGAIAYAPDDPGKWPYRDEFATALDAALRQMHEDGEIEQILHSYMMFWPATRIGAAMPKLL